jgi:hypothetical protein
MRLAASTFIFNDIRLHGFWMAKWKETHQAEEYREMLEDIIGLIRSGKLGALSYQETRWDADMDDKEARDVGIIISVVCMVHTLHKYVQADHPDLPGEATAGRPALRAVHSDPGCLVRVVLPRAEPQVQRNAHPGVLFPLLPERPITVCVLRMASLLFPDRELLRW